MKKGSTPVPGAEQDAKSEEGEMEASEEKRHNQTGPVRVDEAGIGRPSCAAGQDSCRSGFLCGFSRLASR